MEVQQQSARPIAGSACAQHLTLCTCIRHKDASAAVIPSPHLLSFAPVKIDYQEEDSKKTRHRQMPKAVRRGGRGSGQFCPQSTQHNRRPTTYKKTSVELLFCPGYVRAAPAEWKGHGQRRRSGYRFLTSCPALRIPWRNKVKFSNWSLYHMKGSTRARSENAYRSGDIQCPISHPK